MEAWTAFLSQCLDRLEEKYVLIGVKLGDTKEDILEDTEMKFVDLRLCSVTKKCPWSLAWLVLLAISPASSEYHHRPASSFAKFYGPVVVGHDQEIRVGAAAAHLQHHQQHPQAYQQNPHHEMSTIDYVAQPLYDYAYGVTDHKTGDSHGQKERRDGHKVQGEYHVAEPSGNVRTVRYWADESGFHATVHNSDPKAAAAALPPGPARPAHNEGDDGSSEDYW